MSNLEKGPDTVITSEDPALKLIEDMKLQGTSNDLDHYQGNSGDEVDLLGDGVPGYETTGVAGTDDDESLQMTTPVHRPPE